MKPWTKTRVAMMVAVPLVTVTASIALALLVSGSAGGTLSTGRTVITHSDSISLSSTFSSDAATIRTDGKTIVVNPTTLEVDGAHVATIDKDVSDIEVRVKKGIVTFVVDGKSLPTEVR